MTSKIEYPLSTSVKSDDINIDWYAFMCVHSFSNVWPVSLNYLLSQSIKSGDKYSLKYIDICAYNFRIYEPQDLIPVIKGY